MSLIRNIGRVAPKASAVFLCDLQDKFANNIAYFPEILSVSQRLLKIAKILDMPVIVTEQNPQGLGKTVPELGLAEYPEVVPISKMQFSMATPEVMDVLKKTPDVKNIILCGIETHICVQGSALGLLERGYDVHVVVDACSSRTMADRLFAFQRMKASGAWLTTSQSIVYGLLNDCNHPKFRDVLKIVRDPAPDSGLVSLFSSQLS